MSDRAYRLLVEAVRAGVTGGSAPDAGALDAGAWDRLADLARAHRVRPLVAPVLEGAPERVRDRLDAARRRRRALRSLRAVEALDAALDALDGVRALAFKGPTLAAAAHGDVSAREFGDVDLLVPRADVSDAVAALEGAGYRPRVELSAREERAHLAYSYSRELDGEPFTLDVHWRVAPRYFPVVPVDRLYERRERRALGTTTVPALAPEDRLLALAVHGAKHRWHRLAWVADVAGLLARGEVDGRVALELAGRVGNHRMLLLAVSLASSLFDVDGGDLAGAAGADPAVRALSRTVRGSVLPDAGAADLRERVPFHLRSLARHRDRVRYLSRLAFGPGLPDIRAVPLPPRLAGGYYLVRPARLARDALVGR